MRFRTGLVVIFIVLLVIFLVQNDHPYPINFLTIEQEMAGSIFILVNSLLGFVIGFLVGRIGKREANEKHKSKATPSSDGSEV